MIRKFTIFMATTVLVSCAARMGTDFNVEDVKQLQPGVSTITDATALLGDWYSEALHANGNHAYVWMYSTAGNMNSKKDGAKVATLVFGPDGKLLSRSKTDSTGR